MFCVFTLFFVTVILIFGSRVFDLFVCLVWVGWFVALLFCFFLVLFLVWHGLWCGWLGSSVGRDACTLCSFVNPSFGVWKSNKYGNILNLLRQKVIDIAVLVWQDCGRSEKRGELRAERNGGGGGGGAWGVLWRREGKSTLEETERERESAVGEESGLKGDKWLEWRGRRWRGENRKTLKCREWVERKANVRVLWGFPRISWMKCWVFKGFRGCLQDLAHGNLSFGRNAKNQKASQVRKGERAGQKWCQIPHEAWCSAKSRCGRIELFYPKEHGLGTRRSLKVTNMPQKPVFLEIMRYNKRGLGTQRAKKVTNLPQKWAFLEVTLSENRIILPQNLKFRNTPKTEEHCVKRRNTV